MYENVQTWANEVAESGFEWLDEAPTLVSGPPAPVEPEDDFPY